MILQQLYEDAPQILGDTMPPPMYDRKPIRWEVQLDEAGNCLALQSVGGGKENKRGIARLVPYSPTRANVIRPTLIADTFAYTLGVSSDDKKEDKKIPVKHAAFKALVHRCAVATGSADVAAVDAFLTAWDPEEKADWVREQTDGNGVSNDIVTFRVAGRWPTDETAVQAFWATTARRDASGDDDLSVAAEGGAAITVDTGPPSAVRKRGKAPVFQAVPVETECLVTGVRGPVKGSLPGMIKRIPGGQSSGVALVSVNASAFESRGLPGGQTSPISDAAAERFTKALNRLLEDPTTHITMGSVVYVFWTREGADPETTSLIDRPDPTRVRDLLNAVHTGKRRHTRLRDEDAYFALALSASGARAVVRDWLTTTVGTVYGRLAQWFAAQEMVNPLGERNAFFNIYQLAGSVYRDPRKEMTPQVPQQLMRSALHGDPMPLHLVAKAALRCRAEQRVTHARAALIKAALVMDAQTVARLYPDPEQRKEAATRMSELDTTLDVPAYQCGRLLAALEAVQRAALGRINTTLVDRYFGSASTTPATVFGILLTQANKAHLPKIRKSKEGLYLLLQDRIAGIVAPLQQGFPKTLTLSEQGLFALGYYHQRAADRAAMQAAKLARERGEALDAETAAALEAADDATPETIEGE